MRFPASVMMALAASSLPVPVMAGGIQITQQRFVREGKVWPYTVPAVFAGCSGGGAIWIIGGGKQWALNGLARSRLGLPLADPIMQIDKALMRDLRRSGDRNRYQVKITDRDVIAAARAQCV